MERLPLDRIPKRNTTIKCIIQQGDKYNRIKAELKQDEITETTKLVWDKGSIIFRTKDLEKFI